MMRILRQAAACIVVFTVITGVIYPLIVTGVAQLVFPRQANGSLLINNGKTVGSSLIGQSFSSPKYFWARPSATSPMPYNAANSSGSNLGPLNPALTENVKARIAQLKVRRPKPVEEYLKTQGRYKHLFKKGECADMRGQIQAMADANIAKYKLVD